ncbi:MAG: UDP-glucose dehydrogenase family protein [Candidatus Dormibacteria bacterium]
MNEDRADRQLLVVGLWHLGSVAAACWAHLGWTVTAVDPDTERVASLRRGRAPVAEFGLDELLAAGIAAGRLTFSDDLATAARAARLAVVAFDTPVDEHDAPDLSPIEASVDRLGEDMPDGSLIVVMSQIPVGTCARLRAKLVGRRGQGAPAIACSPENLRLGQAVDRFLRPGFVVLGADDPDTLERAGALFADVDGEILPMDTTSAELCKHTINAYLATCISLGNELGNLAERLGADAGRVARAVAHDPRIGSSAPLSPGLAFGGGTLARDVRVLRDAGDRLDVPTGLLDSVAAVNERQNGVVIEKLRSELGTLDGTSIALLGLTYKAGTSTIRRSPAIQIAQLLREAGSRVRAYDPLADETELDGLADAPLRVASPAAAVDGADAVVLATDWPEFAALDWSRLRALVRVPLIVDARNALDPAALAAAGWRYHGIGRPPAGTPRGRSAAASDGPDR